MRKNILLLSDVHTGGEWIATERMVRALRSQPSGPRFYLVAFYNGSYPLDFRLFEKVITIRYEYALAPFSFFKTLYFNTLAVRQAANKMLSSGATIDCVVTTFYLMTIGLFKLQALKNVPRIFFFHGIRSALRWSDVRYSYRDAVIKILERLALLSSKTIIAPSTFGKRTVENMLWPLSDARPTYIVPYYYSKTFFEKAARRDYTAYYRKIKVKKSDDIIVCLRRVAPYKGLENLIQGFAKLVHTEKRAILVIATPVENQDTEVMTRIKHHIHRFHLENKIKIILSPTEYERIALYTLADVTIVPSEYEISPLALRESLLCGTPCIGTSTGDMTQILGQIDKKLILTDNSPMEICRKLEWFFRRSSHERNNLRRSITRYVHQWDENRYLYQFLEVIDRVTA